MPDLREQILARLVAIAAEAPGVVTAGRNRVALSETARPSIIVLDADEAAEEEEPRSRPGQPDRRRREALEAHGRHGLRHRNVEPRPSGVRGGGPRGGLPRLRLLPALRVHAYRSRAEARGGERFAPREAFAVETPPARERLAESRTIKGGGVAGVATIGAAGVEVAQDVLTETQQAVLPLVPYLDSLRWVFIAAALAGIAVAIYARIDDWQAGRR